MDETPDPASNAISRKPATRALIGSYPFQTAEEVEAVLVASQAAFEQWRTTPPAARVACYLRFADTLRSCSETLTSLITAEMGKTVGEARAEVEKSASTLEWIAEHGPLSWPTSRRRRTSMIRFMSPYLPIGTVLAGMPWNLPLWQVIRAAGPIMLSGNGFLLKHAPNVMGCAYVLQKALEASGFLRSLFAILNADNEAVALAA